MSNEEQKILRAKINMETSRIHWKELQRFFANGVAILENTQIDLVEVALKLHCDNKTQFSNLLASEMIRKVSDEQSVKWLNANLQIWAVVVSPWVLVQEIKTDANSGEIQQASSVSIPGEML